MGWDSGDVPIFQDKIVGKKWKTGQHPNERNFYFLDMKMVHSPYQINMDNFTEKCSGHLKNIWDHICLLIYWMKALPKLPVLDIQKCFEKKAQNKIATFDPGNGLSFSPFSKKKMVSFLAFLAIIFQICRNTWPCWKITMVFWAKKKYKGKEYNPLAG